jgi:hypothetical protein
MDYLLMGQFPEPKIIQAVKPVLAATITLDSKELSVYTGIYWNSVSDLRRKIYLKNGVLMYQRTASNESMMFPIDKTTFIMKIGENITNNKVLFAKNKNKSKWKITFMPENGDTTYFEQVDTVENKSLDKSIYAGLFYCDEIDAKFEIRNVNNELILIIKTWDPIKLEQGFKDYYFNVDFGGSIYFKRDKRGKIISFIYSSARTKYLVFDKILFVN